MKIKSYILKLIRKIKIIFVSFYSRLIFKSVGKGCSFFGNISVSGGEYITIGDEVSVGKNLRIEAIDKWKYRNGNDSLINHFEPQIIIGNNVNIEQNVHITSSGYLKIGNNSSILSNVCITNIIHEYADINVPPKNQKIVYSNTIISDNVFIGINSTILPGTILNNHCVVGANSVVKGIFPPYSVLCGNPARIIKKYDTNLNKWIDVKDCTNGQYF